MSGTTYKNKGTSVPLFLSDTSYVLPSVIPPHGKLEACKGRFVGNDKTTPFLRKVKSMWAHGFLRKAYCEFSWGGLRMLSFPAGKERSQGLVSNALDYQSPYASPFTYPPVTRTNKI